MSNAFIALDYSPSVQRARARTIQKIAAMGAVLLAVGLLSMWGSRSVWNQCTYVLQQHRDLNFTDPPNKVVYEEDPSASAKLLAAGGYDRVPYLGTFAGTDWDPVARIASGYRLAPIVFLHRLTDSAGRARLVYVSYRGVNEEELGNGRVARLSYSVLQTAGLMPGSRQKSLYSSQWDIAQGLNSGDRVRFFGGQPDPTDPSRFTIRFAINDQAGVIEGQLTSNDQVILKQK